MSGLIILAKSPQGVNNKISNNKTTSKDPEKDFSQILKGERERQRNIITDDNDSKRICKEQKTQEKEIDILDEEYHEPTDDIAPIYSFLHNLLSSLNLFVEEFDEGNMEFLNIEIEQLSNILGELIAKDNPSFTYEDYEKILEIFKRIDQLMPSMEDKLMQDKLDVVKGWIDERYFEFDDKLDELKEMFYSRKPLIYHEWQYINKNKYNFEEINNSIDVNKTEIEESIYMNKELPIKDEPSIENIVETGEEFNTEQMEYNTPIFQIERDTGFKLNPEIQEKEFQQIDKKLIFEQVVEKAKLILEDNKQEIRIRLKPEILGELILKMEVHKGALVAKALVDNYRTKELLEANLYQFKEDMKENGYEIKTFEVFVGTNEDFQRDNRQEFYLNKRSSKLKIKNNGIKDINIYDEAPTRSIQEVYHEGQLDLFA
ncbi:flagellar hook-length control protein FliK [Clostridium sp. Cult2]|uniref:flagellar hook-length control protein FliK n=1 Tax=Clostridium sp. Cult2 TaxID=2079003 RepID=UPI001F2509C2|nr:flagellar hook-length control protein FliK [Clostridium sp. Cult2]MCF6466311.1 hypothetical protein [Clostridium sp. Cult2]